MTNVRRMMATLTLAIVLTGSLATAAPVVAGAAQDTAVQGTGGNHTTHTSGPARQRSCAREQRRLAFDQRLLKQFAAHTAGFARLEAAATKAGDARMARFWGKVVTKRNAYSTHHQSKYQARSAHDARAHGLVNGKCP